MEKFVKVTGIAAPMDRINIDTDMIIPKLHLRTIKRTGLGKVVFDELRFNVDGTEKPNFILNKEPYRKSEIIVAGDNFGCGSSREHAPWALLDFGIRSVISTSFADIFYNNCFKNGILPVILEEYEIEDLFIEVEKIPGFQLDVDLVSQTITTDSAKEYNFELDEFRKDCLINGLDEIGLTLQHADLIKKYEEHRENRHPWVFGAIK